MFVWQREMEHLDLGPERVLRLFRSLSPVQVALPGLPAQETDAYLVAFRGDQGVRIAVAFDFAESGRVAFYLNDSGEVGKGDAARVLKEGVTFAESMGFMLGDLDYQQLSAADQAGLWSSLPLRKGGAEERPAANALPEAPPLETRVGEIPPDLAERCRRLTAELGRFLASF